MDPFTIYRYASSGFLTLQSVPLLLNPDGIIKDLSGQTASNPIGRYFARFAGLTSISLAAATYLLTESLTSTALTGRKSDALYGVYISAGYLASIASLAGYMGVSTGVSGFYFHTVVGSVLASLGAYCVMNL